MIDDPKTTALVLCSSALVVPDWPVFPRCQRADEHDGLHFWRSVLDASGAQLEVRWSS